MLNSACCLLGLRRYPPSLSPHNAVQVWDANYAGVELLQNAVAESNGEGPLAQGRCGGFGGGVKVVKARLIP